MEFLPNALMGEIVKVVSSFHVNTFSSSATKHPYDLHCSYTHKKYEGGFLNFKIIGTKTIHVPFLKKYSS